MYEKIYTMRRKLLLILALCILVGSSTVWAQENLQQQKPAAAGKDNTRDKDIHNCEGTPHH